LLVIRKSINNRYFKIKAEEEKKKAKTLSSSFKGRRKGRSFWFRNATITIL